jgi:peptidoglycan hydrolase-like protein with peptidoglycan-binding domain
MRTTIRRAVPVAVVGAFLICGSLIPVAAYELDIDDPNLFGPGEGWDVPAAIAPGDSGPWVERLQEHLAEAGFRPGSPDGRLGQATLGAVYAFQKVHDLDRDGVFRAEDWKLLDASVQLPVLAEAPNRVEVDLSKQVLFLVKNDQVEAVLPISSGNGATYRGSSGSPVRARTPEGDYQFYKRVDGWRISYLGGLYRPYYFRGGYAIHGSRSVPPYPASHGCVRVELHDMDYLTTELELGMPVFVYGQRITREDLLPEPPEPAPARYFVPGWPINSPGSPAIF